MSFCRILAFVGLGLLSGCTILEIGEKEPVEVNDAEGGPPPSVLRVPPDLTKPNVNTQFTASKQACACDANASNGAVAAPGTTRDVEQRLQELKTLRDQGLISEEELQQKRKAVLQSL